MRAGYAIGLGVVLLAASMWLQMGLLRITSHRDVDVPALRPDRVVASRVPPEELVLSAPRPRRIVAAEAAALPRTIPVEVTSRERAGADGALVPGVAMVVGVGWARGDLAASIGRRASTRTSGK